MALFHDCGAEVGDVGGFGGARRGVFVGSRLAGCHGRERGDEGEAGRAYKAGLASTIFPPNRGEH